jgi:hypothetical protein
MVRLPFEVAGADSAIVAAASAREERGRGMVRGVACAQEQSEIPDVKASGLVLSERESDEGLGRSSSIGNWNGCREWRTNNHGFVGFHLTVKKVARGT